MGHGMMGVLGPTLATRESSGTSWQPEVSPHGGIHIMSTFGGHRVSGIDDLQRLLSGDLIGQRLDLTIIRRNEKLTLAIVPEASRPTSDG